MNIWEKIAIGSLVITIIIFLTVYFLSIRSASTSLNNIAINGSSAPVNTSKPAPIVISEPVPSIPAYVPIVKPEPIPAPVISIPIKPESTPVPTPPESTQSPTSIVPPPPESPDPDDSTKLVPKYLGCYADKKQIKAFDGTHDLPNYVMVRGNININTCNEEAKEGKSNVFGLQMVYYDYINSTEMTCFYNTSTKTSYGKYGQGTDCTNEKGYYVGNNLNNAIYEVV